MLQQILLGAFIGGALLCTLGAATGAYFGYLRQFDRSLVVYQRDLWIFASIFYALLFGFLGGTVGALLGATLLFWRAKPRVN